MILDFHAAVGHVPTAGKNWTPEDLLRWADLCGTDLLLVESLDNLIHRDEVLGALWQGDEVYGEDYARALVMPGQSIGEIAASVEIDRAPKALVCLGRAAWYGGEVEEAVYPAADRVFLHGALRQ